MITVELLTSLLSDRFQVIQSLGGGGFSQVFEVEENGVGKVLKVLNLTSLDLCDFSEKAIALFRREAEVLSRFRHPGIPAVAPDGYFELSNPGQSPLHCLVMEKIPGQTLHDWLAEKEFALNETLAIDWLKQLVEILSHLHQRQIFHRDIKPSNIMIKPEGQLMLIDFGAVREITETYLAKQRGEMTGTTIISAGYTPAEQMEGQAVPQSDFYALGRTFVYLLTGELPLDLPKDPDTGDLIWRDRAPQISPEFADLLDWLMAPLPTQRPQIPEAIAHTLHTLEVNLSRQHSVFWKAVFPLQRQWRSFKSKKLPRNSLKVGFAAALLVTSFNVWTSRTSISTSFNNWGLDAFDRRQQNLAHFYYQLALFLNSNNAETHYNLGNLYEDQRRFSQAESAYEKAIDGNLPTAYNNLGRLRILKNQPDQALSLLQQGLQLAQDDRDRYALLKNLGWAQLTRNQPQAAHDALQTAIVLAPNKAAAHCLLAQTFDRLNELQNAQSARSRCRQLADLQNPDERLWVSLLPTH